jgi:hypothetical protein
MNWLKKLFGSQETPAPLRDPTLLGLKLGGAVTLSSLDFRVLADQALIHFPGETQMIEAEGHMDLGAGSRIDRFYLTDDAYIQVNYTGEARDDNLEDLKLFVYDDSSAIVRDSDWEYWLNPNAIGAPTFRYRDHLFERAFSPDAAGAIPPIALSERIRNNRGDHYRVDNFCMLYQRQLETGDFEYLLLTAEETAEGRLLSYALGIDLSPGQFSVIG